MLLPKPGNSQINPDYQWRNIYRIGGITTLLVIIGTVLDIIIGSALGGDLSTIPLTAVDRFGQFRENWLLGLYNLDMLNFCTTILMIPTFFALCAAHAKADNGYAPLATVIYLIGAAIFLTNNTALPMLELSGKYFAASTPAQKSLLAAAGEAMVARGSHGSPGAFAGFLLSSLGTLVMSWAMLKGCVFSRLTAYLGLAGGSLLLIYVCLVTFVPSVRSAAMLVAAPGGLLALAWMILFMLRLFSIAGKEMQH